MKTKYCEECGQVMFIDKQCSACPLNSTTMDPKEDKLILEARALFMNLEMLETRGGIRTKETELEIAEKFLWRAQIEMAEQVVRVLRKVEFEPRLSNCGRYSILECPWCEHPQEGHQDDCSRQMLLARAERVLRETDNGKD